VGPEPGFVPRIATLDEAVPAVELDRGQPGVAPDAGSVVGGHVGQGRVDESRAHAAAAVALDRGHPPEPPPAVGIGDAGEGRGLVQDRDDADGFAGAGAGVGVGAGERREVAGLGVVVAGEADLGNALMGAQDLLSQGIGRLGGNRPYLAVGVGVGGHARTVFGW
jgi:hypothetical protein